MGIGISLNSKIIVSDILFLDILIDKEVLTSFYEKEKIIISPQLQISMSTREYYIIHIN